MSYPDQIRAALMTARTVTNREVRELTGLDPVDTAKVLHRMNQRGEIRSVRRGVWRATAAMKWCG